MKTAEIDAREHYLYVNMRDIGCNCGERARGIERGKAARDAWFAEHRPASSSPPPPTPPPRRTAGAMGEREEVEGATGDDPCLR